MNVSVVNHLESVMLLQVQGVWQILFWFEALRCPHCQSNTGTSSILSLNVTDVSEQFLMVFGGSADLWTSNSHIRMGERYWKALKSFSYEENVWNCSLEHAASNHVETKVPGNLANGEFSDLFLSYQTWTFTTQLKLTLPESLWNIHEWL